MKKFTVIMMLVAMCLASIPAKAQFKWGLEGGVNLSKASLSGNMAAAAPIATARFLPTAIRTALPQYVRALIPVASFNGNCICITTGENNVGSCIG